MKRPLLLCCLLSGLMSLLSGCASFDAGSYHRVALINLFPDTVTVNEAGSRLSFGTNSILPAPGLHQMITDQTVAVVKERGMEITVLDVDPALFFARVDAISNKQHEERSFLSMAPQPPSPFVVALDQMAAEGKFDRSRYDLVLFIGPAVPFGEVSWEIGQRGPGIEILHLAPKPHDFTVLPQWVAWPLDLKTNKSAHGLGWYGLRFVPQNVPDASSVQDIVQSPDKLRALVEPALQKTLTVLMR